MKKQIKTFLLRNKDSGAISHLFVAGFVIVALMFMMLMYMSQTVNVNRVDEAHASARHAMLSMEAHGGLTDADKNTLKAELEGIGLEDVKFDGTTYQSSDIKNGSPLTLKISAKIPMYDYKNSAAGSMLGQIFGEKKEIVIIKTSTAKN